MEQDVPVVIIFYAKEKPSEIVKDAILGLYPAATIAEIVQSEGGFTQMEIEYFIDRLTPRCVFIDKELPGSLIEQVCAKYRAIDVFRYAQEHILP